MKILGYDYIVRGADLSGRGIIGQSRPDNLEILYAMGLTRQMQESTVLHEVIEAINYHLKLGLTEKQVMGLETGLYQTLTDTGANLSRLLP
jgi:hypothetical protein